MEEKGVKRPERIAIIGGLGGMGRFFTRFFLNCGFDVVVSDPESVEKEEGNVIYTLDNKKAAGLSDVVVISVPIDVTAEVIREVAPHVKAHSLLMDITSVKFVPCETMEKYARPDVEIIGTHPMFGERINSLEGQVVVLTPVRAKGYAAWLKELLEKNKARVVETTPAEHDGIMAVVQGLVHFNYVAIGKTLEEINFDIKKSRMFASPIYEMMLDMIGRILGQNPDLYASIQINNPLTSKSRKVFLKTADALSRIIDKGEKEGFVRFMSDAARHFDDLDGAMGRSDKAIFSIVSDFRKITSSLGKEAALRHIYTGNVHLGVLVSADPYTVVLACKDRKIKLKTPNVIMLSEEETKRFKSKHFGTINRHFSYVFPESVNEKFAAEVISTFGGNISKAGVRDVYRGGGIADGKKSICFEIDIINDDVKTTETEIMRILKNLGGEQR